MALRAEWLLSIERLLNGNGRLYQKRERFTARGNMAYI